MESVGSPKHRPGHFTVSSPRRSGNGGNPDSGSPQSARHGHLGSPLSAGLQDPLLSVCVAAGCDGQRDDDGKSKPRHRRAPVAVSATTPWVTVLLGTMACLALIAAGVCVGHSIATQGHTPRSLMLSGELPEACDISYTLLDSSSPLAANSTTAAPRGDVKVFKTYTHCRAVANQVEYHSMRDACFARCELQPNVTTGGSSSGGEGRAGSLTMPGASSSRSSSSRVLSWRPFQAAEGSGMETCRDICRAECDCRATTKPR